MKLAERIYLAQVNLKSKISNLKSIDREVRAICIR